MHFNTKKNRKKTKMYVVPLEVIKLDHLHSIFAWQARFPLSTTLWFQCYSYLAEKFTYRIELQFNFTSCTITILLICIVAFNKFALANERLPELCWNFISFSTQPNNVCFSFISTFQKQLLPCFSI